MHPDAGTATRTAVDRARHGDGDVPPDEPAVIEVRRLRKRFGAVTAVDDVSFTVRPGHVTGFLGPNGAGKTTTMRLILGLQNPTAGTTGIGGRPYRQIIRPLHQVGALLDANAVHPARSAYHHLLAVASSNRIGRGRITEVLELTGLDAVASHRAGGFSLGMRQRLGIATALLGDPPVLIFDEPVYGLDTDGIRWIRQLLRTLAGEGRTVLVSSHLMSEMAQTADHLIIIGRGRLVADISTSAFIQANARADVLVRSPRASELAPLIAAAGGTATRQEDGALTVTGIDAPTIGDLAAAHGLPVHALIPRQPSLEDAYLDITADAVDYRTRPSHDPEPRR
jgi:ABC-2 type transport system ATP-binding protein